MIIRLKQGYVDRGGRKPVNLQAGLITGALPLQVMQSLVKRGLAEKVGDKRTGEERRAAAKSAPKKKPRKDD